nr:scf1 [Schizosaccharomyces pombe]
MSDPARKSFTEQGKEKMTPDSSKSTLDKAKESITGAYDKVASAFTSDEDKSTSQEAHDKGLNALLMTSCKEVLMNLKFMLLAGETQSTKASG